MLTWCSRAVNFNFPSCFAASRTRASPFGPLARLGVRFGLGSCVFSLVCGLPSTTSAGDPSLLFGCFAGTAPQYDSPPPCMRDLWLIAFSLRPAHCLRAATGSPGSRAWSFSACFGVFDSAGTRRTCDGARRVVAFQIVRHRRLPASRDFGAQYPAYRYPCPTLQVQPRDCPHMVRGQGGSLRLPCTTLSLHTPCRFIPALSGRGRPPHRASSFCCAQAERPALQPRGTFGRLPNLQELVRDYV